MKKLIVALTLLIASGCAHNCPSKSAMNGKDIYVGMSQAKFEEIAGAPLATENSVMVLPNLQTKSGYLWKYASHNVRIENGAVAGICELKK